MANKMADYIRGKKAYTKWDVDTDNVDMDIPPESQQPRIQVISAGWFSGKKGKILKTLFLVFLFLLGLILGYLIRHGVHEVILKKEKSSCVLPSYVYNFKKHYAVMLQKNVDTVQLENNLRLFTEKVHRAGSEEDKHIAQYIKDKWKLYNFSAVRIEKFNVLLSLPSRDNPNKVELLDKDGESVHSSSLSEDGNWYPEMQPFSAYSQNGTVKGKLIYANYGTLEDFEYLKKADVPITGNIVIMRSGKTHRGGKIKLAEKLGAVGVLLYPDPADYGGSSAGIYPNGLGLPPVGIIRGSIKTHPGDPQTPFLPSYDGIYRKSETELDLPKIVVQPISYQDAEMVMRHLGGPSPPEEWKGMLNISYSLGPTFDNASVVSDVRITVYNELQHKEIHNVVATIPGEVEPGRYVIIGGHHDSWTNGSSDPGTGVAVLMELSRIFHLLRKEGWKPGRTIVFASWDAEEFGMIGSTEWVEAHAAELRHRAVTYINIDAAVTGNYTLQVLASPLLKQAIKEATREVPCMEKHHPDMSLFDMWRTRRPQEENSAKTEPLIEIPGSGSDFVSFMAGYGIPSVHLQFVSRDAISDYPLYHTSFDTFDAVANYTDPGFTAMATMTELVGILVMKLSDSVHLPIHVQDYSSQLKQGLDEFLKQNEKVLLEQDINVDIIEDAVKSFDAASKDFNDNYETVGKDSLVFGLHEYNDRMIAVERALLLPNGVSVSPNFRHAIYGPDPRNYYKGVLFPHVLKALHEATEENTPTKWNSVRIQLSYVLYALRSAVGILNSSILSHHEDEL